MFLLIRVTVIYLFYLYFTLFGVLTFANAFNMQFRESNQRKPEIIKYISNGMMLQKRSDYRDNEVFKIRNDPNGHLASSYGDRFIPRRYEMKANERNKKFYSKDQEMLTDILKWSVPKNYWLQNQITDALNKCFDIKDARVLNFTDSAVQNIDKNGKIRYPINLTKNKPRVKNGQDWSCNPRKKPFAYFEATHDSVGFSNCFDRNLMDWSINGQVAASFENDVIIWKHICDIAITFSVENMSCLSYCPKGKYLALGCKVDAFAAIELWDVNKYTVQVEVIKRIFFTSTVVIKCFEWSKCGKFLLCGTNKGTLHVFNVPNLKRLRIIDAHNHPISTMKFSPTMRFLASADTAGIINIHDWFSFSMYLSVHSKQLRSSITLDWHPWNGVELAIAEQMPASIVLINVPSKEITAFYRRKDKSVRIHSLAFNKITAELLLSISRENSYGIMELKILVLASLDRLVDVLTIENGTRFLMWDPEGSKVVTAGTDDSLSIWSFYAKKEGRPSKHIAEHNVLCSLLKRKLKCRSDYGSQFQLWSTIK